MDEKTNEWEECNKEEESENYYEDEFDNSNSE